MYLFIFKETGWPITCHSLGLGMPANYPFGTCGRPVPGWNGKKHRLVNNIHDVKKI